VKTLTHCKNNEEHGVLREVPKIQTTKLNVRAFNGKINYFGIVTRFVNSFLKGING
jgi:hypothetical protein